ncbi:MAG: transketolase [Bacteroidetes bacterium GWA2_32_17]|nr:MAG: transketolase [Bacteroidetes bacterium GWA2_32_17]
MNSNYISLDTDKQMTFDDFKKDVLNDFYISSLSRHLSVIGRKEVLTGKAKFGIFGDGKELAQVVMAKNFKNGDWRSGYYRDQTFMLASGLLTAEQFFAQLYGDTDIKNNPHNSGRSFNNHFSTANVNPDGSWKNLMTQKNSAADLSPTAGQMPRLTGLAWASKLYRENKDLTIYKNFSDNGNEVAFGTIGDASTSEGHFWETINAVGVLKVPMALFIFDDGYGISVPKKYQTTKQSISQLLSGFEKDSNGGIFIYKVKGWDYAEMVKVFSEGVEKCRKEHIPVVFHIEEMTQPLGHSTSGSHERYKSPERLTFENEFDPIARFRNWLIENHISSEEELNSINEKALNDVKSAKQSAWNNFNEPIKRERNELVKIIDNRSCVCKREHVDKVGIITENLKKIQYPIRKDIFSAAKKILRHVCFDCDIRKQLQSDLQYWLKRNYDDAHKRYNSHLYVQTEKSALNIKSVPPIFTQNSTIVNGREVLRDNWDYLFQKYHLLVAFGEDVGHIGGVNQSFEGLQKKYGELRISDTGIRETTILGQGIGLALRGLRPLVEIQYFDYLLYALQTLSDDLASLHYRTAGGQKAPVIISTRGHRLEGIWHSGSPLSMVINSIRGVYVLVPRNMTQAAGFYNTLFEAEDAALVIEPLNGYRLKEKRPDNIGEYKIPIGVPEILNVGNDITLITYGSCVRIAQEAVEQLKEFKINVELIDVQSLLPFDVNNSILESVKKTNKIVFFDEDVPGGATAFMLQKVLEEQGAYKYLDSEPITITAQEHRPAYATDGDYFSNPNAEDVFEGIYNMMHNYNPKKYPQIF